MGVAFGCVGNTIRLRSGHYLDLSNPQKNQFTIEDIAGGLSKICRFGGQIDCFYSVAEHAYWCATQAICDGLTRSEVAAVLMHDAAEAFVGDIVKPLKIMLPEFLAVEGRVERVIEGKFGVDFRTCKSQIRKIDHEMLIAERRSMFSADDVQWAGETTVRRLVVDFQKWTPFQAEGHFLRMAKDWLPNKGGAE